MGLPEIIDEKSKKLITFPVFGFLIMSRKLEHVVNETFKNAKGECIRAHLITKQPILLREHGNDLIKYGYIITRAFANMINKKWDELAYLHGSKADSFTVSSESAIGAKNECLCAVNFYKTEQGR